MGMGVVSVRDQTVRVLSGHNESDEERAWNLAQLAVHDHQDVGNTVDFALRDLSTRFPEFEFTAGNSMTGPMEPRHISTRGR